MALPNAEFGNVRVRFATEASGWCLHIAEAKEVLLNKLFAERYGGQLIVRFDDTNPAAKGSSNECEANILKDIETLGITYERVTHASDYFPELMLMVEKLIREDKAYVDDTERDQMWDERRNGIESKCRNQTVDENLNLWQREMVPGTERGLKCCLRGKLGMQNPDQSLRDPVYYRCSLVPHYRVGSNYKVYPTYDFASPFIDSMQGITHVFRSTGCNALYRRVLMDMDLGLEEVRVYNVSPLYLDNTLSKRRLPNFLREGLVDEWDDPRLPTVQGFVRRGLKPEALYRFTSEQGASNKGALTSWDQLWNINKKLIGGSVCTRHTAVTKERRVLFTLIKNEGDGVKEITFAKNVWIDQADAMAMSEHEEVTLRDYGNAIVKAIIKDPEDGHVIAITGFLHPEASVKTTKLKLTWLPDSSELVSLTITEFGDLLKEGYNYPFQAVVNVCSRKEVLAFGDSNMKHLKSGDVVRLDRKGYFRCDVPFHTETNSMVLFAIPDGKTPFSFE